MKHNHRSFALARSLAFIFILALALAACSGGEAIPETALPALPESAVTLEAIPTELPQAQEPSPLPQATDTQAAPTETAPAPTEAAPAAAQPEDARQAVIAAMRAMREAGPYRVNVTSTSAELTVAWSAEVILPDRFHLYGDIGEYIIVGNQTYMKQEDAWTVFPMDMGSILFSLMDYSDEEAEDSIRDAQRVGPETVNGEAATVYQYQSTGTLEGAEVSSQVKMWVRDSDGLPVRLQIDGVADGIESTTVQEIEYDPSITIEPPVES